MARATIPNDPSLFPEAPRWLTWTGSLVWDSLIHDYAPAPGGGRIKTFMSLYEAKKSLNWIGTKSSYRDEAMRGRFIVDWTIYEWVDSEWVERYFGLQGDARSEHPLWKRGALSKEEQIPAIQRATHDAAIRSILEAVQ